MAADAIKTLSVAYREGERIIAAGEAGACLFLIQSGSVRLSRPAVDGEGAVEPEVLGKGDVFGEGAVLAGRPYSVTAEALTDCEVVELGAATCEKMLRAHPEIAVRFLHHLAARLERAEERLRAVNPRQDPWHPVGVAPTAEARPQRARLVAEPPGVEFSLTGEEILIGRYDPIANVRPDIDLASLDEKRSVSRRHARLVCVNDSWRVTEEGGVLNGTFVNGIRLRAGEQTPLREGDVVALGMVRLVYRDG